MVAVTVKRMRVPARGCGWSMVFCSLTSTRGCAVVPVRTTADAVSEKAPADPTRRPMPTARPVTVVP